MAYEDGGGVKSPLRYIGSKRRIAARIASVMDTHICYVEPFGGSAAVLLAKAKSPVEVYNDWDGGLVNFFRVCRDNMPELMEYLKYMPCARAEFDNYAAMDIRAIEDPVRAAAAYFYMNRCSYAGKQISQNFGYATTASISEAYVSGIRSIPEFASRLQTVLIEHLHWSDIIDKYDRPETLFYCDPPYYGAEQYYVAKMATEEHLKLAEALSKIQGKAIVSYYESPEIDAIYGQGGLGWTKRSYRICKNLGKTGWLIRDGSAKYIDAFEVLYSNNKPAFSLESMWHDSEEVVMVGDDDNLGDDNLGDEFSEPEVVVDNEPSLFDELGALG